MTVALTATAVAGGLICLYTLGAALRRVMAPDRTAGIPAVYARQAVHAAMADGGTTAQTIATITAMMLQRAVLLLRPGVISSAPCSPRWPGSYGF